MPVVVPLSECRARPDEQGQRWPLSEHLIQVASWCGKPDGNPPERLAFLAGLLHDAGKCQAAWQLYAHGQSRTRPPHAPLSAALFAWIAEALISAWEVERASKDELRDLCLDWTRIIYCHHDELDDLDLAPPWEKAWSHRELSTMLQTCDVGGLIGLVRSHFTHLHVLASSFAPWLANYDELWERSVRFSRPALLRTVSRSVSQSSLPSHHLGLRLPLLCGHLISADRYHAGQFQLVGLASSEARSALQHLRAFCERTAEKTLSAGASPKLIAARTELQQQAVARYQRSSAGIFFSLTLPTGYGKTLTSMRVALEAVAQEESARIVFVAPYLSILSQAAEEVYRATNLPVVQHHSLALLEQEDDNDVEALDSWQAPVILTTFNQLFRVLFPFRAQQTVRARALHQAFIVIDEPQIIDVTLWNLFLTALHSACKEWGAKVLLNTATLPPTAGAVEEVCISLNDEVPVRPRYEVRFSATPMGAQEAADWAAEQSRRHAAVAVVLNTVADAVEVYHQLRNLNIGHHCTLLTALMLPGHKRARIQTIRQRLGAKQPTVVICTQMLEAGVDLSFARILRALPVFPAVAQVAGRANRHGEGHTGIVEVRPFIRTDGKDSRCLVYRDETARRQTDTLLHEHDSFSESGVGSLLRTYFARCWEENRYEACLSLLEEAARGAWSKLGGLEPFAHDYSRVEVFVPCGGEMVPPYAQVHLPAYAPQGPAQLLDLLANGRFHHRSFEERKRIHALVHCFTVPVHRKVAEKIAHPFNQWLWVLKHPEDYSQETGLAGVSTGQETAEVII